VSEQTAAAPSIDGLAGSFEGKLVQPGDEGYDEARKVWNGMIDRHPALVAQCRSVSDVVAAVSFARENDMVLAVRGGGHSASGAGTCDDGLVIDLSPMKAIQVDPQAKTVRAAPGLTWAEFDAETQKHGLAVTGGRFSTTGIAGLTLGSGSGWLERKCGLTADNLISAQMVIADGSVLTASETENEDLFWGIRGGSGNFGIVTEFEYRLHDVGPMIYGGLMAAPPDRAAEFTRFMRDYMKDAPEDLGAGVAFISAPPAPHVPPEMHFAPLVGCIVCWTGDHEEGERVVAPIREALQPVMDMVQPMPYVALQTMLDDSGPHGTRAYVKAEFLEEMTDAAIDTLVKHGNDRPGPMVQLILEPMGGAISSVGEHDTSLGRRDVAWVYHALAMWMDPSDEVADQHYAWAKNLAQDVEPHTTTGVYLNFTSDGGEERVRSAYGPEKYARLQALKDRYDPGNLFRLNQNIAPTGSA
jgi:FAD/FMN-containing dehydrogenase